MWQPALSLAAFRSLSHFPTTLIIFPLITSLDSNHSLGICLWKEHKLRIVGSQFLTDLVAFECLQTNAWWILSNFSSCSWWKSWLSVTSSIMAESRNAYWSSVYTSYIHHKKENACVQFGNFPNSWAQSLISSDLKYPWK